MEVILQKKLKFYNLPFYQFCIAVFVTGVAIRAIVYQFFAKTFTFPDTETYQDFAENLLHGSIQNPNIMPGYPLFLELSNILGLGVALDILISVCTSFVGGALVLRLSGNKIFAGLAILLLCFNPYLIFFSTVQLSETIYIFFLVMGLYLCVIGRVFFAINFLMIAIYIKPVLEPLFFLLVYAMGWAWKQESDVRPVKLALVAIIVYCALLFPWWVHNFEKYGVFVRTTLAAPIVLYAGNNELNKSGAGQYGVDFSLEDFSHIENPITANKEILNSAIDFIRSDYSRFLAMGVQKVARQMNPLPNAVVFHSAVFNACLVCFYLMVWVIFLLALVISIKTRTGLRQFLPFLLYVGYSLLVCFVFIGSVRYRVPAEVMAILFGCGVLGCYFKPVNRGANVV